MSRQREVLDLLRQLTTRTDQWVETRGRQAGVHRTHLHALSHLMQAEQAGAAMSPTELAAALGLSASATTALVDRLVDAGHVERSPHADDRRRTVLTATAAAHETGASIFVPLAVRLSVVVDALDDDELAVVTAFLSAIVEQMDPGE